MKFLFTLLAGLGHMISFGAHAGEVQEKKTAGTNMEVNRVLSGKTATTYLRTSETPESPKSKFIINQALSGKTAVVYVRVPQ